MRDAEILDEIEANARELIELGATAGSIPDWDLNVAIVGAGLTISGMVLTGPLSLVGLALGGAGLAVIGVDMAKKMSTLRTAAAVASGRMRCESAMPGYGTSCKSVIAEFCPCRPEPLARSAAPAPPPPPR